MSIEIKGVAELIKELGLFAALDKLEPPMRRAVYRLQAAMQDYPPAPSASRYIRTGTLGRRWTTKIERSADGLVGTVGNNTAYGPWVQSERFQARVHRRTGWMTDERAMRENEQAIVDDFEREIDRALAKG